MHFAAGTWLVALIVAPVLWLAVKVADRRAERRVERLLGARAAAHREDWQPRVRGWRRFLYLAGIFWLIVALARPQWGASEVTVTQRGRDVVVALDVSNSMLAEDVTPSRLERAKAELTTFLRRQADSRVGLVLFAGAAFVQCPLTADYGTAEIFLQMAAPDMISAQGTALSAALEVSRELLLSGRPERGGNDFQAILLVTDGEDLEGNWEEEARACRREGITVIPVGIGEETGGLIPVTDAQGRPSGFLKDEDGQLVLSRIDLASLERLAAIGGGSTFRVGLDGLAGERLRTVLERLGQREFEQRQVTRWQERYPWFLGLSLVCLCLAIAVRSRRRTRMATVAAAVLLLPLLAAAPASAQVLRPAWADNVERGRAAYAAGDYETALQEFETARAQAPDDPRLSLAVGETLFHLKRHEEAEREFTRARQLTDRTDLRAESLYNAGTNALAQGDAGQAVQRLRESLRLEPDRNDALRNLEAALLMQQQQDQQQQDQQQQDQQDQQQQDQQDQQDQQQQDQQQQDQQDQPQQDQQDQQDQQQPQESRDQPDPQDEQEQQEQPSPEEIDKEQALQILKALDRDEQELKRAVQRRLRGGGSQSGKRW